jgi:hypothetical protein
MQYKQAERILIEIIRTPAAPVPIVLAAIRLLSRLQPLPKLGPYPKRSAGQILWRTGSNSASHPEVRWAALRRLLALRATQARYKPLDKPSELTAPTERDADKDRMESE